MAAAAFDPKDEALLEEIRDRFAYAKTEWQEIHAEGAKDMRYIAGDPWDPEDRRKRNAAGRPCLSLDELGQYVNQGINKLRQNKRGIKVSPVGNGATDKTAAFRQGKIRDIEYRSNAQQAYITMAENAFQRSYGYLRVKAGFVDDDSDDQELIIEPIVNPDNVFPDPDFLRGDGSDWGWLFYIESRSQKDFKRQWPNATVTNFEGMETVAPQWVKDGRIQIAEYWTKTIDPSKARKSKSGRKVEGHKVVQYLTNGVEILEKNDWAGSSIPFVGMFGKVIYVDEGAGSKRKILSLIRLARDPYMLYCYYRTCQAELVKITPKFPYFTYRGQLDQEQFDNLSKSNDEPVAAIILEVEVEGVPGAQLLPPPVRVPFDPPIQALEMGAEAARRAIQAAVGVSPLPTQAQRKNEKSGVALKQIEDSEQTGSFHFTDHYDEAVTRCGQILDQNIKFYYDTARETSIRKPDDSPEIVRVNDPGAMGEDGQPRHIDTQLGTHDVTISVGPAMESEREAASQLADALIGSPEIAQVIGPQKMAKLIALSIKLKAQGPTVDEMVNVIDPKDPSDDPNQVKQMAQQLHEQNQQLTGKLQQAAQIIQTKQVESQSREKIAQMQIQGHHDLQIELATMNNAAKIEATRISAAKQQADLVLEAQEEQAALHQQQMFDASQTAQSNAHELAMAAQEQAHGLEAGDAAHQQALEQGEQGHQQTLDQTAQAAALQPPDQASA